MASYGERYAAGYNAQPSTPLDPVDDLRLAVAIEAAADALLSVCALETGTDPVRAADRAWQALDVVYRRAERDARDA